MGSKALDIIIEKLPERMRPPLRFAKSGSESRITELVLRAGAPLCVYRSKRLLFLTENGILTDSLNVDGLIICTENEIEQTLLRLCDYSIYAHQNEMNSGFITIEGGVRVGLCGRAVMNDGRVSNVRDISTLSFRISRDIEGCSVPLLTKLEPLHGVLVCGAPGSGKTTIIRDMARQLSYKYRVSLLDERGELSAHFRGKAGFSTGLCDVYTGYPKGIAANCALRSMAPEIIICDEMGDESDVGLLMYSMRCGAAFIATVHADSMDDLRHRDITSRMINTGAFRYIVFLSSGSVPGRIEKIYEMCDTHA